MSYIIFLFLVNRKNQGLVMNTGLLHFLRHNIKYTEPLKGHGEKKILETFYVRT